jgi:membrane protease YdiL (CAAX protease family)
MSKDSSSVTSVKESAEITAAPTHVPWGPWAAVIYAVVVYFAAQMVATSIIVMYPHLRGWSKPYAQSWLDTSVVAQFFYVLMAEALTFGAIWWYVRHAKKGLRSIGWRRPRLIDPALAVIALGAYFAAYLVLLGLATHLFPSINVNQKQELGFQNATGASLVLTFLSLVVLPPLVEETVFRGFVFSGLRTKLKPVLAALLTSALFASAHLQFGSGQPLLWVAAIDTFTLSLVLCYLRFKTDSLWPGIMLHALKNGIAFTALFLLHAR